MVRQKLKIGSRESKLAVIQARMMMEQIKSHYPEIDFELVTMKTTGDKILDQTLDKIGGKGLFVKELETGLQQGVIDLAVHSLKDMAADIPPELPLVAFSKREDPRDVLVLPEGIDHLDPNKPVGCSSARRNIQLTELIKNIRIEPVRGNVLTRISKLDEGQFSGLVLAFAGLKRLGLQHRISNVFSVQEILPAAGQGILAVQGRLDDDLSFLHCIDDQDAADAAKAEREFVKTLQGGCSTPIAALASVSGNELQLTGLYVDEQTGVKVKGSINGSRSQAQRLGAQLAQRLFSEVKCCDDEDR
ncbi:MAG: hydroxymethylbilane synthase [Peptococcaceae bacterium]|nr:hydroxymethylbilane synthase [Peptococcaceae bacterium]